MQLSEDCTDVIPSSDTKIFHSPNREAPAFFKHGGKYYLWTSGTLGWSPCEAYVYSGPTPLGPFNQSLGTVGMHISRRRQPPPISTQ